MWKKILIGVGLYFFITSAYAVVRQEIKIYHVPQEFCMDPIGLMDPDQELHLAIGLPIRNKAQLKKFLQDLYDPSSPAYRHYLTPQEFTERFGPAQADYDAVAAFFKDHGFRVIVFSGRKLLDIDGTVRMIEKTFHITLRQYKHPTEGRSFYTSIEDPAVDLDIPLAGITGLDDFVKPRPVHSKNTQVSF